MFRNTMTVSSLSKFVILTDGENYSMNETEFDQFYREHSRPLWAYIRRVSGSEAIADDVTQESFLKFLGATLKTDENQKAYLYRIATNLIYDHFRRQKRELKHQIFIAAPLDRAPFHEPFAPDSGLAAVFDKLNLQERSLLWLAYVEEHRHDEIAQMLGLKSLSVRVLLFRAKRKLTGMLDAEQNEVQI